MNEVIRENSSERHDTSDLDRLLDEALRMTFPASDPISLRLESPRGERGGLPCRDVAQAHPANGTGERGNVTTNSVPGSALRTSSVPPN